MFSIAKAMISAKAVAVVVIIDVVVDAAVCGSFA